MFAQSCPTLCDLLDYISHQTLLSIEFSRQEHWSGLLFPAPGGFPAPGIEPESLASAALVGGFFATVPSGKPQYEFEGDIIQHVKLGEYPYL